MPTFRSPLVAALLAVVPALPSFAPSQCTLQWSDTFPMARIRGSANFVQPFDADGAGPLPTQLVVGGNFQVGQNEHAYVAAHDGQRWTVLDPSFGFANACAPWNGQLAVAGFATQNAVRSWNGSAWTTLGAVVGEVKAMAVHNGQLVVAGTLTSAGGVAVNRIARFDGTTWSALGTGVQGTVNTLAVLNGSLYVGGALTSAGGTAVSNLAIWNGSAWSAGPVFDAPIETLAVRVGTALTNTFLWAGGAFNNVGAVAASRVVRFSPSSGLWTAVPGLPGSNCRALFVRGTGLSSFELSAAVDNSGSTQRVFRLLANVWTPLGDVLDAAPSAQARALGYHQGRYVVAQSAADAGVQTFDGASWSPLFGEGMSGRVRAVTSYGGDVVVVGAFATVDGQVLNGLARRSGNGWAPIGGGLTADADVRAVAVDQAGGLCVGGAFVSAGGTPVQNLARWDGSSWSDVGGGVGGGVHTILPMPNGDVIVGGDFVTAGGSQALRVARWDGFAWSSMGLLNGTVRTLALLPNGDVVAGGEFTADGGNAALRIARWTGSGWAPLGAGCNNTVFALAVGNDGSLYAGGRFTAIGGMAAMRLARWDGTTWTPLAALGVTQDVLSLAVHPGGALLVGGGPFSFSAGPFGSWTSNLLRFDGFTMSPLDVDGATVDALAIVDGDVVLGGQFDSFQQSLTSNVARLSSSCAALVTSVPSGCVGQGPQLAAFREPWLGAPYQAFAAPFAPTSLAVEVYGFTAANVPLPPLFPVAEAGCTLLATPDVLTTMLPSGGFVVAGFPVPLNPGLVGIVLHHQFVEAQFGFGGALAAVRSSNALRLTIGTF